MWQSGLPPVHEAWLPNQHPLYRPRHAARQRHSLAAAVVFFCLPLVLAVAGVRAPEFENRRLAEVPSLTAGWRFFTGFDSWATDHLPLRDVAVDANDAISRAVFGEPPDYPGGERSSPGPVNNPVPPGQKRQEPSQGFRTVIEGDDSWLYLGYDVRGACHPDRSAQKTVKALQRLRAGVEATGRAFVLVVAPNKTTMVPDNLPDSFAGKTCAGRAQARFWTRTVPEIGAVDLRDSLLRAGARVRTPVYTKFDSHWTPIGALTMVRAIAEAAEPGITANWRELPGGPDTFAGDLPPLIGKTGAVTVERYQLAPDGTRVTSRPIAEDFQQPLRLTQPAGPGLVTRRVGMVADSFTQQALPYLAGGFADVSILHAMTAGKDPAAAGRMLAETDVVVVEVAERFLTSGGSPMTSDKVIDGIIEKLAASPR